MICVLTPSRISLENRRF